MLAPVSVQVLLLDFVTAVVPVAGEAEESSLMTPEIVLPEEVPSNWSTSVFVAFAWLVTFVRLMLAVVGFSTDVLPSALNMVVVPKPTAAEPPETLAPAAMLSV